MPGFIPVQRSTVLTANEIAIVVELLSRAGDTCKLVSVTVAA